MDPPVASTMRGTEASASFASASSASASAAAPAASAVKEGKLPLPDDFFKPPPLSTKERAYLVGLAKRACKEVVYYSRKEGGPMRWVHLSSEDGIELCQGVDESAPDSGGGDSSGSSLIYLRGATKIYASIDEIADFFRLDTPEKLGGFAQTVGKDIMDQRTLYTLATPTVDNPKHFVAAKWVAVESPSKLARNRDFCYLECHDEFIDTNSKKRGWVRSVHSVRLPFCPRLDRSHGLVRGSLYRSGFVFLESSEKGCVDAIHTLHMDVKGNSPNWIKVLAMKRRIKNIAQVNRYFQLHRLTQGKLLGDLELPAKAGVARCERCEHKFGLFNRKRRCRKCGKVVCTACATSFLVDYAGAGPKKVRVCVGCSEAVVFGKFEDPGLGAPVSRVKQVHDADLQPIYDPSPRSGSERGGSELRHFSAEEHDFYLANADERGLADMMEAKRMQEEFEAQVQLSARSHRGQASSASSGAAALPVDPIAFDGGGGGFDGRFEDDDDAEDDEDEDDDDDDDESGHQQRRRLHEVRRQEQLKYEQQRELHAATQTVSYQQRALGRSSSLRRSSKDDEQLQTRYRFTNGSPLDQQDPLNQRSRHSIPNGDHYRRDSNEVIRMNSDWGTDHSPPTDLLRHHSGGSFASSYSLLSASGSMGAAPRRSDLSADGSRTSYVREHSIESSGSVHQGRLQRPSRDTSFASSSHEAHHAYDEEDPFQRRLSAEYAAASQFRSFQHAESPMFSGSRRKGPRSARYGSADSAEYERLSSHHAPYFEGSRRDLPPPPRYSEVVVDSRSSLEGAFDSSPMSSFGRRQRRGGSGGGEAMDMGSASAVHSPLVSSGFRDRTSSNGVESDAGSLRTSRHPDTRDRDELAHFMALSAMKLFDREHGQDLHVPDDVRQAALSKMMAVYASEIERNSAEMDRRSFNAPARYGSAPHAMRRSASGDLAQRSSYHHHSDTLGGSRYDRAPALERAETYELGYLQHKSSPAMLQRGSSREPYQGDVRDLSDLTSSAFQALQISSEGGGASASSERHSLHLSAGLRRNDSFMGRPSRQQEAELRESLDSSRHSSQLDGSSARRMTARSRAASGATRGSSSSSNEQQRQSLLRASSAYGDAESDTFSELDFVELPHLMRKDYVPPSPPPPPPLSSASDDRSNAENQRCRNSFTDIHQWQQQEQAQAPAQLSSSLSIGRDSIFHGGVERRLSELNPDDHIFRQSHDGGRGSELYRNSSVSSGSARLSEGSVLAPPPSYAVVAASSEFSSERDGPNSDSDDSSSSSFASDGPDYSTETLAPPLSHPHAGQMTLSELERYRASLAELMSDYNRGGNDYHRVSIAESTTSSLSIGSTGFYNPLAARQPEGEPDDSDDPDDSDEEQSQRDSDSSIKPTPAPDGRLQEMYL